MRRAEDGGLLQTHQRIAQGNLVEDCPLLCQQHGLLFQSGHGPPDRPYVPQAGQNPEEGVVKNIRDGIRILGNGELTKKLTVQAMGFSKSAEEKIVAAGGKIEVI